MAKREFGLARAIGSGGKIFYENLFSQFQIGRMIDLFCAVASQAGVHMPSLREILDAVLLEASRCQGLFDSKIASIDPVTVELGTGPSRALLSVQFSIASDLALTPDLAQGLIFKMIPAREVVFRVDPESRRAEIYLALPLEVEIQDGFEKDPARFELLENDADSGAGKESEPPVAEDLEYVELADAEYESTASTAAEAVGSFSDSTQKILRAAAQAAGENETVSGTSAIPEEVARALASQLPPDELARVVKGAMNEEELARVVTGGLPEEELAQLIKGSSTPEELRQLVKVSGDRAQLAEALLMGSPANEAAEWVRQALGPEKLGEAIATSLPKAQLAQIAASALPPEEVLSLARENLPPGELARTVAKAMSREQVASFAEEALETPELAKVVMQSLPPAELVQTLKQAAPEKLLEAARVEAAQMPAENLLETLKAGMSPEEYAKTIASSIPRDQFKTILMEGLPPQEMARSLAEGLPKDKFAQLLATLIPKDELARVLASFGAGDSSNSDLGASQMASPLLTPTQEELKPAQVAKLLSPELSAKEAVHVLSSVLPLAAAESMLSGDIPHEEVTEALRAYLPDSADPEVAEKVAERIFAVKAAKAEKTARTPKESQKSVKSSTFVKSSRQPEVDDDTVTISGENQPDSDNERVLVKGKPGNPAQESVRRVSGHSDERQGTPSVMYSAAGGSPSESTSEPQDSRSPEEVSRIVSLEREKIQEAFEARLNASKKSVEFYLARAKKLETRLHAAENAKAAAEKAAQTANHELEEFAAKSLEKDYEVPDRSGAQAPEDSSGPRPAFQAEAKKARAQEATEPLARKERKPVPASPRSGAATDPRAKRNQEAARFFQSKALELEQNLRKSEAEIRRLKAEHTKELIRVSRSPDLAADAVREASPTRAPERRAHPESDSELVSAAVEFTADPEGRRERSSEESVGKAPERNPKRGLERITLTGPDLSGELKRADSKIRILQDENDRLRAQLKNQRLDAAAGRLRSLKAPETPARETELKSPPARSSVETVLDASSPANAESKSEPPKQESVEPADPIEAKAVEEVERDMGVIVKKIESARDEVPEGPIKRTMDGLMTTVMQEKAKVMEMSREMSRSLRKKELSFKNREAVLNESLKQTRALADQRQASIERMKQQVTELQIRADRAAQAQTQTGSTETQLRMKYEQSQRQIEVLNKEIEKVNRRLQQSPQTQGNNPIQERHIAELRKELETGEKAMKAKKQELETLKAQIHDRDRREEQFKRQIMKLQGEIVAARSTSKKAS